MELLLPFQTDRLGDVLFSPIMDVRESGIGLDLDKTLKQFSCQF
jgi:hypothetical protein